MSNPTKKSIEYIATITKLDECVLFLNTQSELAFDFEFDSNRFRYGYTLCLIQICAGSRCFIIEPFEFDSEELAPVFKIFEDKKILKIVHSGGEDLRILQRLGYQAKNLFDTQVAAQFLGHEKTSLGNVLQQVLEIELDKKQQDSNWVKRPLSPEQIKYAANDVLYLSELREKLLDELSGKNELDWFNEEMAHLNNFTFLEEKKDPISRDDRKAFSVVELFILRGLLEFRESVAKNLNRPVYQIFKDDYAREIVREPLILRDWPSNKQSLTNLRNLDFQHRIQDEYYHLKKEAETYDFSKNPDVQPRQDGELRMTPQKRQENELKYLAVFKPLKDSLSEDYNVFIANNVLSRDTAMQLIGKYKKIADILPTYKQKLILDTASKIGFDLNGYL